MVSHNKRKLQLTYHQSGQTWAAPQEQCRWLVGLEVFEVFEEGLAFHIMVSVQDLLKSRRLTSNGSLPLRYD